MSNPPTFDEYLASLAPIVSPGDLLQDSNDAAEMRELAVELAQVELLNVSGLAAWIRGRALAVHVLGLSVGLSGERLKNICKHKFDTGGFSKVAKLFPTHLVELLVTDYGLLDALDRQRHATYGFGDILVARATTGSTAARAGAAGRSLEDRLEEIAHTLGLLYRTRGRFTGRAGGTAPYDLAILDGYDNVLIAVAAKGFDSTGSKLTDALREIEQMADVRLPTQFIFAAVDGIGWKQRQSDLRKIHGLWTDRKIDGVYTVQTLPEFQVALEDAAKRVGLIHP